MVVDGPRDNPVPGLKISVKLMSAR